MTRCRRLCLIAVLSLLKEAASGLGQQVGTAGNPSQGLQTLRSEARLVGVYVTVVDGHGLPIGGLTASDFEVRDNGLAQRIKSLEEHGPVDLRKTVGLAAASAATDGSVSATNRTVSRSAVWNVLLVDLLNTPKEDLARANKQLIRFLGQLPPGEPIALMTMSPQIRVLVSFEGGAGSVTKFLASKGLGANGAAPVGVRSADEEATNAHMIDPNDENFRQIQKAMTENYARSEVELKGDRVLQSLSAFAELADRLRQYPGRKNVYWISAGFPLQAEASGVIASDQMQAMGAANQGGKAFDSLQQSTLKEMERTRIAIYPIDTRGVEVTDIAGETGANTEGLSASKSGAQAISAAKGDRLQAMQRTEMLQIASQTGGVARFSNDIGGALQGDFQQSQEYYTIFYTPTADSTDSAYYATDVTVKGKGEKVFFRRGYFARKPQEEGSGGKEQFKLALTHGRPAGSGVVFSVKVFKRGDTAEVDYAIDPRGIEYSTDASGKLMTDLDCAVIEYDGRESVLQTSLIDVMNPVAEDRPEELQAKQTIPFEAWSDTSLSWD